MPWRNGRGSTLEILREPGAGESFAWRLSLADIDEDGEFSSYPGYRRAIVLVCGKSLRLRFHGHGRRLLGPRKRGARFEGDWSTHCTIPDGRCTDLSLIVRRGPAGGPPCIVRAPQVLQLESTRRVTLASDLYGAVFALDGSLEVCASTEARPHTIRARDTLLLDPGPARALTLRTLGRSPVQLAVLRWQPGGQALPKTMRAE